MRWQPGSRLIATCLTLSLIGLPALAPPAFAAKPAGKKLTATDLAAEAKRRFEQGEFVVAAELFMSAYKLDKRPAFIFNAARAYEKAGKKADAVAMFRLYMTVTDDPVGKEEARVRIEALEPGEAPKAEVKPEVKPEPKVEAKVEPKVETKPDASPDPKAEPKPAVLHEPKKTEPGKFIVAKAEPTPKSVVTLPGSPTPRPAEPLRPPGPSRVGGWVTLGVSAAALIGGASGLYIARKRDNALQTKLDGDVSAGGWVTSITQTSAQQEVDAIGKIRTWGAVGTTAGLVGCGVATWLLVRSGSPDEAASIFVVPSPTGLAIGGNF